MSQLYIFFFKYYINYNFRNNLSEKGLKKELNQEELKKENLEENEGKVKKVAKNVKKKIIETSKKIFKSPPI